MKHSIKLGSLGLALAAALHLTPSNAAACGGFFCASTPVDQNAERIVFKVRDDGKTDMIVQITYQGKAEDFAWLLPLSAPPKKEELGTFPQQALTSLDAQTGVSVQQPCFRGGLAAGGAPTAATNAGGDASAPVDVYVRAQIGNYEVAVIGSTDAQATADWLKTNGFRISDPMLGFIKLYTQEGMKFLALKLLPEKTVNDITPFKLTLPGDTPSIPLRLSAIAAEPEMGIVVWILGSQRYEPAGNVAELSIDDRDLRMDPTSFNRSNWTTLVARAVDAAHGAGFVVEDAQPIQSLQQLAQNSPANTAAQMEARTALLDLFANTTYLTRFYTRLSPEEMTFDPSFRRSKKGDVSRFHTIANDSDGGLQCVYPPSPVDPCDFVACGALGLCRTVDSDAGAPIAGCACADGATARATFVPSANSASFVKTVSCVDKRLSYLNPGDRNAAGEALPDPCVGIDCGGHGKCVAMNMTPTCECEHGYIAEGLVDADGKRSARCLKPSTSIPDSFYNRRPMPRDAMLPIGRAVDVPAPTTTSDPQDPVPQGNTMAMGGNSATSDAGTSSASMDGGASASSGTTSVTPAQPSDSDDGCSVHPRSGRRAAPAWSWLLLTGLAAGFSRSRRRTRRPKA